jgi:hypothetical protein
LKNNYGKNAAWSGGHQVGAQQVNFNSFEQSNVIGDPLASGSFTPLPTGPTYGTTNKANLKGILGDALGGVAGDLIQAKKDGQTLPPLLDFVAKLGIKTEQAALNAAQEKAYSTTGKNVLQFSPLIIGAIVGVVLLLLFMFIKK